MKKVGIILVVLGVVFIGSGLGYFCYSQFNDRTTKEEIPISKKLISSKYSSYSFKIEEVVSSFNTHLSEKYPIQSVNALSAKEKTLFLLKIICGYQQKQVTVDQVVAEAKAYFTSFEPYLQNIKDKKGQLLYSYQDNKFTYSSSEAQLYNFLTEDLLSEGYVDQWVVKKKAYYMKSSIDKDLYKNTIYSTVKDYKEGVNSLGTFTHNLIALKKQDYETIKDKLDTLTYHFTKVDKTYFLDSIKIEK